MSYDSAMETLNRCDTLTVKGRQCYGTARHRFLLHHFQGEMSRAFWHKAGRPEGVTVVDGSFWVDTCNFHAHMGIVGAGQVAWVALKKMTRKRG